MTNASEGGATQPGPAEPGPADRADDTTQRWEALFDEMTSCGHAVLDRVSNRARENVTRARKGEYGLNAWLEDVRWFWTEATEGTSKVVRRFEAPKEE